MTPRRRNVVSILCAAALACLILAILLPPLFEGSGGSAEREAATRLKLLRRVLLDFKENDRDGNKIKDFWVFDIAGLRTMKGPDGAALNLIEADVAAADAAAMSLPAAAPKNGYYVAVVPQRADGTPYDRGLGRNPEEFAICAWPAPGMENPGKHTFLIDAHGVVIRTAVRPREGRRILRWPSDDDIRQNWQKVD